MQSQLLYIFRTFALKQWSWYLAGTVFLFLTSYVSLKIPELSKAVVDSFVDTNSLKGQVQTTYMIALLGFSLLFIRGLSRILLFWPARRLETEVKDHYFGKFLRIKQAFFDHTGMGDLISRIANDVTHIRVFFGFGALQILNFFFMVTLAVFKMYDISPVLTVSALCPIVLSVAIGRFGLPRLHTYSKAQQAELGKLTNKITEAFVNVHVIQANNAASAFTDKVSAKNLDVYKANVKQAGFRVLFFPLLSMLTGISYVLVMFVGGGLAIDGKISVGDLLAFNAYIGLLSFPLMAIGILLSVMQRARTAAERLAEIDAAESENVGSENGKSENGKSEHLGELETDTKKLHPTENKLLSKAIKETASKKAEHTKVSAQPKGSTPHDDTEDSFQFDTLHVRNLTFRYPFKSPTANDANKKDLENPPEKIWHSDERPENVLEDISFEVQRGEHVGIVGPIGSGKSTLLHLLVKLYDAPAGTIFYGDKDIRSLDSRLLRKRVVLSPQVVHLFSDSVKNNLLLGYETATDEAVVEVTRKAEILKDIETFDEGWQSEVGEKGLRLSGGQKQRLALARTLIRKPELYLLDDVLSAVDHTTEKNIIDHLRNEKATMIIVSHRSSAVMHCDKIIALKEGKIVATGTYQDILRDHPSFFEES